MPQRELLLAPLLPGCVPLDNWNPVVAPAAATTGYKLRAIRARAKIVRPHPVHWPLRNNPPPQHSRKPEGLCGKILST